MKKKITLLLTIIALLATNHGYSQPFGFGHWRTSGNPGAGLDGVNSTNNKLGSNAGVDIPIRFVTDGIERMRIENSANPGPNNDGFVMMGNNLAGLTPTARLHLHQPASGPMLRFTNGLTGTTASSGLEIGITGNNGEAQIKNWYNADITWWTVGTQKMVLTTDGILGIGIDPPDPDARLDAFGPIRWTNGFTAGMAHDGTVLYGVTNMNGTPINNPLLNDSDGFRIRFENDFAGVNIDSWIFEKTDGNDVDPDGSIVFMNTGNDGVKELAMIIEGNNDIGIGPDYVANPPGNRFEIDAIPATDASGLRFRQLNNASPVTYGNPNNVFLTVDDNGDVVLVDAPSSGGGGGGTVDAFNGTSIDPSNGKVVLGNNMGATLAQLESNREIPMNNHNVVFTDNTATNNSITNRIGIGTNGPLARLHVKVNSNITQSASTTVRLDNGHSGNLSGTSNKGILNNVVGDNYNNEGMVINVENASNSNVGITTIVNTSNVGIGSNRGGSFLAENGENNHGVGGSALSSTPISGETNKGVTGLARNNEYNIGGEFTAQESAGVSGVSVNYGIRTRAIGNANTNIGIDSRVDNTNNPNNYAGFFVGSVHVDGTLTIPSGTVTASDQMFKNNINDLANSLYLINQLQPRTFDYDTANFPNFNFESDSQMGLIAQEVEQVIPAIVSTHIHGAQLDSLGNQISPEIQYKGIEYGELITLLIAGMQEQQLIIDSVQSNTYYQNQIDSLVIENYMQQTIIDDLNDRLTTLEDCLSNILPALCNANSHAPEQTPQETQDALRSAIDVELFDGQTVVLEQNVPNPFAERTTINYTIPETVKKAQILFYNSEGNLINSVNISERGNGRLNVFAEDLSSGTYTYTLVADERIISTKKMVKH